jgi:hypothetical protein
MSVEDRLRRALRDQAESWDPLVEASLLRVRRRWVRRRVGVAVLATAAAVAVIVGILGLRPQEGLAGVPADPAGSSPSQVAVGRYVSTVASPTPLAGDWVLNLRPDGRIDVTAPPGYAGVLSGVLFSSTATTFRTTLFQEDVCAGAEVGSYTYTRTSTGITFVAVDDACASRKTFLSTNTWRSAR